MELKDSKINNGVSFTMRDMKAQDLIKLRRANMQVTHFLWITQKPKWDTWENKYYNPQTPILLFIN